MRHGGFGVRSAAEHSPAAFLASATASHRLCADVDRNYSFDLASATTHEGKALFDINAKLPVDSKLTTDVAAKAKQKTLSRSLDEAAFEERLQQITPADKANLRSECQAGARDFLTAVPNPSLGNRMEPVEFVTALKLRLCMKVADTDAWCPLCDATLDHKGHHASVCCAGGDRTVRHNRVRNQVFQLAKRAALNPELERSGLLLPASHDDVDSQRRRPADVYLPAWLNGSPAALDFAVTAPQRQATIQQASMEALFSARQYSDTKRAHLDTARLCSEVGVEFQPMVCETTGAWSPEAFFVLKQLSRTAASLTGRDEDACLAETLQNLSVTVRRCQARALLRRLA